MRIGPNFQSRQTVGIPFVAIGSDCRVKLTQNFDFFAVAHPKRKSNWRCRSITYMSLRQPKKLFKKSTEKKKHCTLYNMIIPGCGVA